MWFTRKAEMRFTSVCVTEKIFKHQDKTTNEVFSSLHLQVKVAFFSKPCSHRLEDLNQFPYNSNALKSKH